MGKWADYKLSRGTPLPRKQIFSSFKEKEKSKALQSNQSHARFPKRFQTGESSGMEVSSKYTSFTLTKLTVICLSELKAELCRMLILYPFLYFWMWLQSSRTVKSPGSVPSQLNGWGNAIVALKDCCITCQFGGGEEGREMCQTHLLFIATSDGLQEYVCVSGKHCLHRKNTEGFNKTLLRWSVGSRRLWQKADKSSEAPQSR